MSKERGDRKKRCKPYQCQKNIIFIKCLIRKNLLRKLKGNKTNYLTKFGSKTITRPIV